MSRKGGVTGSRKGNVTHSRKGGVPNSRKGSVTTELVEEISDKLEQLWTHFNKVVTGQLIASIADSHIGSDDWSIASSSGPGPDTDKAHLFVEDVVDQAGGSVPKKFLGLVGAIGLDEWGDAKSSYLVEDEHWYTVSKPSEGDIICNGKHMGIITGYRTTTHAGKKKIKKDNWGFKPGQWDKSFVVWRYKN